MQVLSLDWEDPMEESTATHFIILAWRIPWTEEPDVLESMGSQRGGHDLAIEQQQHIKMMIKTATLQNYSKN